MLRVLLPAAGLLQYWPPWSSARLAIRCWWSRDFSEHGYQCRVSWSSEWRCLEWGQVTITNLPASRATENDQNLSVFLYLSAAGSELFVCKMLRWPFRRTAPQTSLSLRHLLSEFLEITRLTLVNLSWRKKISTYIQRALWVLWLSSTQPL